jgi:hypothetical protein
MPAANIASQAGESQINLFEITSNYSGDLEVTPGVVELNYYESLLDNSVRVTSTLVDAGGNNFSLYEDGSINLTTGERVQLKMVDGYGFRLDFINEKHLRIDKVRDIEESTNKMAVTLDLFSKECIDNELDQYRVRQRFDGKISDSLNKILTEILKTEKDIDIDETLNNLSFIGNVEKPFYKCTWLAARSVPDVQNSKGNLAGYFFYETYDGFKFKSIDKLFIDQEPKRKMIFNNTIGEIPEGYDTKILDFSFDSSLDLKSSLVTGSQTSSKLEVVNAYESAYRETDFESSNQFFEENTGGIEQPKIASDLQVQQQSSSSYYKWDDPGFLVEGPNLLAQLPKSTYINYNNDEILRQSKMRYNNLFSIKLSITISGDFSLRAGDLVHCDFAEISNKSQKTYSNKKSGLYMIVDVCHRITSLGCHTKLNLVRESIGRKSF